MLNAFIVIMSLQKRKGNYLWVDATVKSFLIPAKAILRVQALTVYLSLMAMIKLLEKWTLK